MKNFIIGILIGIIATVSFGYWLGWQENSKIQYSDSYYELINQGYNDIEAAYFCGFCWQPLYVEGIGFEGVDR